MKHLKGQNEDALAKVLGSKQKKLYSESTQTKKKYEVWSLGETMPGFITTWISLKEAQKYVDKIGDVCKKLSSPSNYKLERPEIDCEKGWALLKFEENITKRLKPLLRRLWKQNQIIQNLTSAMPSQCIAG